MSYFLGGSERNQLEKYNFYLLIIFMVYKSKSKIEIVFSRLALHTAFVVVVVIVAAIVGIICIIFFIIFTADVHFESVLNGGLKKALGKHSPNCRGDKWLNTSYTHTHTYTQRQTVVLISLTYSIDTGSIWGLCLSLGLAWQAALSWSLPATFSRSLRLFRY